MPDYPLKEYYGDLGDFVQNKGKEWADLCDRDDHPCAVDDYKRGFNNTPRQFMRFGVATRLNRFLDHYARPPGNTRQPRPENDVTVSLQTCPQNATDVWPLDQPGERFNALTFGDLAPNRWSLELTDAQPTTADVEPNPHAMEADPVANPDGCPAHTAPAGAGVAVYDSDELAGDATMIGQTRLTATVEGAAAGVQLNARLYDLYPDGTQVLVDRGVHTLADDSRDGGARPARQRMAVPGRPPRPRRDHPGRRPVRPQVGHARDGRRRRGRRSPSRSGRSSRGTPATPGPT